MDAARKPRAQLEMHSRMRIAAARNVQLGLVNYKRLLKIAGMSEAEIHSVIPDRPSAPRKPPAPSPTPPTPPPAAEPRPQFPRPAAPPGCRATRKWRLAAP